MKNFESLMNQARTFQQLEPDPQKQDWYVGYMRGLRRAYHGERFGTAEEHLVYMDMGGDRQALGDGYRAGYAGKPIQQDNHEKT
ncbi:MAG: hypothetical protein NPIRA02_29410 [Nitrospirales bacterium]|nr:MAG: hypothetical protein NPIRA02_29410 [Nitrospirales bacterium]